VTSLPRRAGLVLAVLLTATFMTTIDNTIVNVAIPAIRADLEASGGEIQLVVAAYLITYAVFLITGARLGDLFGYRRLFLAGLAVFSVASLACGLAPDAPLLILARAVQGAGAAMLAPQVLSGIQLEFEGEPMARAIAYYSVAIAGGAVAGQVLGGALVGANLFGASWRPIFLINVPLGVAGIVAAYHYLPPRASGAGRGLDLVGVGTLSLAILLLLVPLTLGREGGWPPWAIAALALSPPALWLFVRVERHVDATGGYPLLDLALLRRRVIAFGLLAQSALTVTASGLLFVLAIYLQDGLGRSPLYSGLMLAPWIVAFGVASRLMRSLPSRIRRLASPLGFAGLAAALLVLAASSLFGPTDGPFVAAVLGVGGIGTGLGFTGIVDHMTSHTDPAHAPDLSGFIGTNSEVFGAVGVATFGSLFLALAPDPGGDLGQRALSVVLVGFGLAASAAAASAYRSIAAAEGSAATR
jgi:MFS family permease